MAYDKYSKATVFENKNINAVCNRIIQILIDEFTLPTLETDFCLTGTVAKIIQGASLEDITVIPFATKNLAIFKYCGNELAKEIDAAAVNLKDRVQMNYKGIYFEFWYEATLGTINTVDGILLEDPADISINIK